MAYCRNIAAGWHSANAIVFASHPISGSLTLSTASAMSDKLSLASSLSIIGHLSLTAKALAIVLFPTPGCPLNSIRSLLNGVIASRGLLGGIYCIRVWLQQVATSILIQEQDFTGSHEH